MPVVYTTRYELNLVAHYTTRCRRARAQQNHPTVREEPELVKFLFSHTELYRMTNPVLLGAVLVTACGMIPGALAAPSMLEVPGFQAAPSLVVSANQDMVFWSQIFHTAIPHSDGPATHKLVFSCTGDALIYAMNLHVSEGSGKYTIQSDSVRLDGMVMDHTGYLQQSSISTDIIRSGPIRLGAETFPLVLSGFGSLMIPIETTNGTDGARIVVDVDHISGSQTVCSLDMFEPTKVAGLFPLDADFGDFGSIMLESTLAGVVDFNTHLKEVGEDWRLEVAIHDTVGADIQKLSDDLSAEGISTYLGPPDFGGLAALKVHAPDAVALSCCGTSSPLAEPDGVFRMAPSDGRLGADLARLMWHNGIRVILPVWTDDPWNNSYRNDVAESFVNLGGAVDDGIMQDAGMLLGDLGPEIRDRIVSLANAYGHSKVAVVSLPTEDLSLLEAMGAYQGAETVRWFGTDYTARDARYTENPSISEFTSATGYTALQVEGSGPNLETVRQSLTETTGRVANHDMLAAYESAWVLGLAIQHTQSMDPDRLRDAIPYVSQKHFGTLGPMILDANGDLHPFSTEVWSMHDGQWVLVGVMR